MHRKSLLDSLKQKISYNLKLISNVIKSSRSYMLNFNNDGAYGFSFKTYYIGPKEQIEQLSAIGFKNIRIYSLTDGKEIKDKSNLYSITDDWLYYLCNV